MKHIITKIALFSTICNLILHYENDWCSVGMKYGLQLVLNIEQYEYMAGPQNAVGVKLVLHQQDAIPLVQDFGYIVRAGTYTTVEVSVTKVSSILVCL